MMHRLIIYTYRLLHFAPHFIICRTGGWGGSVEEVGKVDYIPLQRVGSKEEMANAVVFLVSDACPYISGTCTKTLDRSHILYCTVFGIAWIYL